MAKKMTITIGRTFGSGGHDIGKKLAELLDMHFYDKELLNIAAKESGICRELFESNDEKPVNSLLYTLSVNPYGSMGALAGADALPINQKLFLAQFDAIRNLAKSQNCVIVGRCADYALREDPDCFNVFIHAPLQYRISRIKEAYEISSAEARDLILKTDKKRAAYYNAYSDRKWGNLESYHLSLDSSVLGQDNAAALIAHFAEMRQIH